MKMGDASSVLNMGMKAAEAANKGTKAAGPLKQVANLTVTMGNQVNKAIPKPVQNLLLKRQDELQAGVEFTKETVNDIQVAMAENNGQPLSGEQIRAVMVGNAQEAAVGYVADTAIGSAVEGVGGKVMDRWRRRGGRGGDVEVPDAPKQRAGSNNGNSDVLETPKTSYDTVDIERVAPTNQPELKDGLASDRRAREIVEQNPQLAEDLAATQPKRLEQLTAKERDAEIELANALPSKPIGDGGDYVESVELPNKHECDVATKR